MVVLFVDIGGNYWPSLFKDDCSPTNINKANNHL
jgi:hypothetical protein